MKKIITFNIFVFLFALMLCVFAFAGAKPTSADAVSWVQARKSEGWAVAYDASLGPQCVDLIKYYFDDFFGIPHFNGDAYSYASKTLPAGWTYTSTPSAGDIAVWKKNQGIAGIYGHVAIVESAGASGFSYIDIDGNTGKAGYGSIRKQSQYPATFIHPDFSDSGSAGDAFPAVNTYKDGQFSDVSSSAWYSGSVASVYEKGLMKGSGSDTFNPTGCVTIAEAVTMASRIHSIYNCGSENFRPASGAWYNTYMNYAFVNGIIDISVYSCDNPNAKASHALFAEIFAKALPADALPAINSIPDYSIPDVGMYEDYAGSVYLLYRAGILTGSDSAGSFRPEATITRAEAAALISRMVDSSLRKSFSLS
ncbi:MAG: S-layer homology domain-containing protein [Oscillospiraceae bacterium]|nr:S-layer homology domain-containing protein [Oscillospiraceae bacterium]